jgi:chromosome segregation ATPase
MTKDEIELMQDSIIQASNKVELLQKTIIEKAVEIERLKAEYSKLQEQFAQYQMASDKEIVAQVKQAKIDVLSELEEHIQNAIDVYWDSDGGRGYCHADNVIDDIEEMIEELTKCRR